MKKKSLKSLSLKKSNVATIAGGLQNGQAQQQQQHQTYQAITDRVGCPPFTIISMSPRACITKFCR